MTSRKRYADGGTVQQTTPPPLDPTKVADFTKGFLGKARGGLIQSRLDHHSDKMLRGKRK